MHILLIVKPRLIVDLCIYTIVNPRLIVIYAYTPYREATPNLDLCYTLRIVKPRLIVIYTHTLYREATPNRDLYIYSLS